MDFTWPVMLWGLVLLPILVGWYVFAFRRVRRETMDRFAERPLFLQLAAQLPRLRRHISMALYFIALGLMLVAAGRPVMAVPMPVNKAVVLLLIDTSGSMAAPDVTPSRLEAAKAAGRAFVDALPQGPKIGLVTFSTYATLNVPPTPDHEAVKEALAVLRPQEATAIGDGILVALKAIPGRTVDLPENKSSPSSPFVPPQPAPPPVTTPSDHPEELSPAAIILLSDGGQNAGTEDPLRAALLARQQKVKIYTVGLGTPGGGVFQYQGQLVLVPFDPTILQQIAAVTDGKFFFSPTANDLKQVYRDLGRVIGWENRKTEVSAIFTGGAGLLLLGGGMISLLWTGRLP